jgi:hypothetical protein
MLSCLYAFKSSILSRETYGFPYDPFPFIFKPIQKQFRNNSETIQKQFRNNSETIQKQFRNNSETKEG